MNTKDLDNIRKEYINLVTCPKQAQLRKNAIDAAEAATARPHQHTHLTPWLYISITTTSSITMSSNL